VWIQPGKVVSCDQTCDMHQGMPTFSGFPLKPTSVPFRVYKFCEADMDAERREKGLLKTSKRASIDGS